MPENTIEELKRIKEAVSLPIVVIGGINKDNAVLFGEFEMMDFPLFPRLFHSRILNKQLRKLSSVLKQSLDMTSTIGGLLIFRKSEIK